MDPWQAAYAAYIKDLNAEEQALFATATLDNLLASTDTAQKQHKEESRSRYIFDKLQPLVDAIDQYGRALDAYASTYSLAMGPIWGSIRVLLHVILAFHLVWHYYWKMPLAQPELTSERSRLRRRLENTSKRLLICLQELGTFFHDVKFIRPCFLPTRDFYRQYQLHIWISSTFAGGQRIFFEK